MTSLGRHPNQRTLASLPAELRRTCVPETVRAWIRGETGATVLRVRRLPGASSSALHGLTLSDGRRLVLRRYVWRGFLDAEPIAPRRELDGLGLAFGRGLRVPEPVAADVTGEGVGDGVPVLLMAHLPGAPLAVPDLERLAGVAAAVHDTDPSGFSHEYFPWYRGTLSSPPPGSRLPHVWERAIELWPTAIPDYRPAFIHRDLHPGNVLWSRGELSGVVDWANVCRGPRGCDIAHCRANLLELSGPAAADRFLSAYEALTGETQHPYWEMASILEHEPAHWTPERLARWEPYLARAVKAI